MIRRAPRLATLAAALAVAAGVAVGAAPARAAETEANGKARRIVSINLCTDQLVLMLAERPAIASVSYLARDPSISPLAEAAEGIAVNHGRAEEILGFAPDLVLTGPFTGRTTAALLRRLGLRVLAVDLAQSLADVRRITREVGAAIGEPARAERLIAEMDAAIAALPRPTGPRPLAAVLRPGAVTMGRETLMDDLLAAVGFDNLAARRGLVGYGYLPLEALLLAKPDIVVLGPTDTRRPALADKVLRHPALARAAATWREVVVPGRLWDCGTPLVARAAALLAGAAP